MSYWEVEACEVKQVTWSLFLMVRPIVSGPLLVCCSGLPSSQGTSGLKGAPIMMFCITSASKQWIQPTWTNLSEIMSFS